MATAKSITYKLKAEYEGKGDIKQLSADLKALGQIDALKGLEESFTATNKQMVEAKAKVRSLRQDMKDSGGDAFAGEYENARKEVVKLNTSLKAQKENLIASRAALNAQGVDITDLSGRYDSLSKSTENQARVIAASKALQVRSWTDIKSEIAGLERAYLDLKQSGTLSADELAAAQTRLQTKVAKLNASMDSGVKKYSKIGTAMTGLRKISTSLINPLTTMVGAIGLVGAGFGISQMVSDVVAGEKALDNMSRTAGMSVSDFQAYAFGVKTVGLESDKLADISKDVRDKLGDFIETGGGEFADFFKNIAEKAGVTAEELIKLSGPDALIAVKKAMDDANVSAENQVFYLEAIANDASVLMPLLEDNGAAWKTLAKQAEAMGVAISDIDHRQLIELGAAMSSLQLSMGIVKREAVLALTPALKDLAQYMTENTEEVKAFVASVATGVSDLARFVAENRELIVLLGKGVAGFAAMSVAASAVTSTIGLVTTAMSVLSVPLALAVAALGSVAYAVTANVSRYQELNRLAAENTELMGANATASGELADKFSEISKATGTTITSMDELDRAVAEGKLHFNESTGEWVAGYKKISAGAKTSADDQERVTGEALEAMKKQYQEYASEVARLQEEIVGRERSLADELRGLLQSGMSDVDAWEDQKKQAEEYKEAAEEAAEAGDFTAALEYADKAKDLYSGLNTEVKENGQVVVSSQQALDTAMAGVKESGELAITILKQQQDAAAAAMEAISDGTGFSGLNSSMDASKKQWLDNWEAMKKATLSELDDVEDRIEKIVKDRETNVYVNVVEKKQSGGLVGSSRYLATGGPVSMGNMLSGGHFTGYGGGDRRHVVAEDGEVMIRKESVRSAGLRAALAFNSGNFAQVVKELTSRFNLDTSIYRQAGGPVNFIPRLPPVSPAQHLSTGGKVTGSSTGESVTITFAVPGASVQPVGSFSKNDATALIGQLQNLYAGSS